MKTKAANDPWKEWRGMPEFKQAHLRPCQTIKVHFETPLDRARFAKLLEQALTEKTRAVWYPRQEPVRTKGLCYVSRKRA